MGFLISCNEKVEVPKAHVIIFFETYENQGIDIALNTIFQTNEYMVKQSQNDLQQLRESLHSLVNAIGNYHGYEIISEYSLGKSIMHFCCIVKYDIQPIRFNFTFYKPDNSWRLQNFNFDNSLITEMNDMAKYNYF